MPPLIAQVYLIHLSLLGSLVEGVMVMVVNQEIFKELFGHY
jgi:hypothetical protein